MKVRVKDKFRIFMNVLDLQVMFGVEMLYSNRVALALFRIEDKYPESIEIDVFLPWHFLEMDRIWDFVFLKQVLRSIQIERRIGML